MHTREFSGGVFSDQIEGGRAGAEIELTQNAVSARTSDGRQLVVPYGECQVEFGGYSGRMVFCRTRDRSVTIFCENHQFAQSLASASLGLLEEQIDAGLADRRRQKRRARQLSIVLLLGIVLLLIGGYYAIRIGAQMAVQAAPVKVDRAIGRHAFASMELGGPELNDPVVQEALQSMVERMAPHAALEGLEFEVHVVESPQVNAFALPGGTIVVYTGLIEQAETAQQVAGVLGHEMAHATLRHGLERISQALGLATAVNFLLGDTQGLIMAGAELFQLASINSYSREQEVEADREGVRMMHQAGLNPLALTEFFDTLHEQHGELPGLASWISTHPQHQQRIEAVRLQVQTLPKIEYRPLEIDWDEIQRRVANH